MNLYGFSYKEELQNCDCMFLQFPQLADLMMLLNYILLNEYFCSKACNLVVIFLSHSLSWNARMMLIEPSFEVIRV